MTSAPHQYTALHGEKKEDTEVLALLNSFIGVGFLFKFGELSPLVINSKKWEIDLIEYYIPWSIITKLWEKVYWTTKEDKIKFNTAFLLQGKLGVPGLPGYPGRQGPKVSCKWAVYLVLWH